MTEILLEYGLFFAKALTVVAAIVAVLVVATVFGQGRRSKEHLEVRRLDEKYEQFAHTLRAEVLDKKDFKAQEKARKKQEKADHKARRKSGAPSEAARVYVVSFKGDIRASAVASLREEVSAILTMARPEDEVVLRLENAGGLVHEHGLAASQLMRLRAKGIPLTVIVDKVAASGGYMMACVGNRILAAPFAILGSIGVLVQMPNFNRLLDARGVDFEQLKGGEFKRTLTMFGKNTDEEREKMQQEVDEIHGLFKRFVGEHRPELDLARVATGEHWYGSQAVDLKLCDELKTSDDYLMERAHNAHLYELSYAVKGGLSQRLAERMGGWLSDQGYGRTPPYPEA